MPVRRQNAGQLNLIPSPKGNIGARRHASTSKHDAFCVHYKLTGRAEGAADYVGFSRKYAHELLSKSAIQKRLKKIDSQMLQETIRQVVTDFVLTQELLDENLADLVVNGLDRGADSRDIIRAIEVGYRRLGLIE